MSDLYPTKTRLALLRDVADGNVRYAMHGLGSGEDWLIVPNANRKVTARIDEMYRAGWVVIGWDLSRWTRPWQLTDAGRAVLDTHGRQS